MEMDGWPAYKEGGSLYIKNTSFLDFLLSLWGYASSLKACLSLLAVLEVSSRSDLCQSGLCNQARPHTALMLSYDPGTRVCLVSAPCLVCVWTRPGLGALPLCGSVLPQDGGHFTDNIWEWVVEEATFISWQRQQLGDSLLHSLHHTQSSELRHTTVEKPEVWVYSIGQSTLWE